jgi:hypothetical protein
MAVRSFKLSTIRSEYPRLGSFTAGNDYGFELIESQTVGSGGAASITFSNIPSTYKHLQIRCVVRSTIAGTAQDNIAFRCNSDSASNYASHNLWGTGSGSGFSSNFSGLTYGYIPSITPSAGNLSNVFAGVVIDILDYSSSSKNKTWRAFGGSDENANSGASAYLTRIQLSSAVWLSTSTLNRIDLTNSGSFAQHSTFSLYGVK